MCASRVKGTVARIKIEGIIKGPYFGLLRQEAPCHECQRGTGSSGTFTLTVAGTSKKAAISKNMRKCTCFLLSLAQTVYLFIQVSMG